MQNKRSLMLKAFVYFLVAMMLFSAIGVMVIYLNVPAQPTSTSNQPTQSTGQQLVTIPSLNTGDTQNQGTGTLTTGQQLIVVDGTGTDETSE